MQMTPTPEDYKISPEEALEINSKATQGTWLYIQSPTGHENIYVDQGDGKPVFFAKINSPRSVMVASSNAAAIAYNHNVIPGLCRRLQELEDAVLHHYYDGETEKLYRVNEIIERIQEGRENAKAD